jgi:enamine deaminase RidA (YjgF/YER057c/UK114 family)
MKTVDFDGRIAELGIELPAPPNSYFSYVPALIDGNRLFISGQICARNGEVQHAGRLGESATLDTAKAAARLCALNILAQVRNACGGTLNRVSRCVRIVGYVNATPDCLEHGEAMEGCSALMQDVFGDLGRHTRTTVGVISLPLNALIEVEAIFSIRPPDGEMP